MAFRRVAPCAKPWCEAAEAYLHHLIIIHIDAYQAEQVAKLLDLQGVACDGHVLLLDVVQLLVELKLPCGCVRRENLPMIFPRFLRRLGFAIVDEHVIVNTCRQAIHYAACDLRLAPMLRV